MSENKHTPEPWRAFNNGQGVVGVSTDRSDVCWTRIEKGGWLDSDRTIDTDYENARRIVACVNACAGFSTETLELIASVGGMQHKMTATAAVASQRDELLAALDVALENLRPHGDNCFVSDHYEGDPGAGCNCGIDGVTDYLISTIARAKGEQP